PGAVASSAWVIQRSSCRCRSLRVPIAIKTSYGDPVLEASNFRSDADFNHGLLGKFPAMTRAEAQARLEREMAEVNQGVEISREVTFGDFTHNVYLPFCRRKWKTSTASTSEQRIKFHLVSEFGSIKFRNMLRDPLQDFLDRKAQSGLSLSVVDHLRW